MEQVFDAFVGDMFQLRTTDTHADSRNRCIAMSHAMKRIWNTTHKTNVTKIVGITCISTSL